METSSPAKAPSTRSLAIDPTQLSAGSIGTAGIVFFVVAAAAPLAATLGAGPVVFMFAGPAAPAMYLIASLALLLFAFGFSAMSRYVTNAGGFAAFISWGLGRWAGFAAAGIALVAYLAMFLGISAQFATFTSDFFNRFVGLDVPWQATLLVGVIVIGLLAYRDIRVSTVLLGIMLVLELLFLLVFDVAVLAQGGAEGINAASFSPADIFSPTMGLALLFAFACFVGFEATILYGEEAREPKKSVPRATYIAVIVIGVSYTLTMWALALAYGVDDVQDAALADPVNFVLAAVTDYLGGWAAVVMELLVVTSLLAVLLSFHNALNRYVFSLGRSSFLPGWLGHTHPRHRSPSRASVLVTIIIGILLVLFMFTGQDPFAVLYMWMIGLGTLGLLLLQAAGAAAVIVFLRRRSAEVGLWSRLVAPLIGGAMLVVAVVLAVTNFEALIDTEGAAAVALPALYLVAIAAGLIIGALRPVEDLRTEYDLEEPSAHPA
ncbi:APC family permease (plasmid) [Citricoccus sp. SGAir0253]|uniref:APC family permease n=1 Tax=Citricoccus sp. SGAir0253 TaxID=2567881 RepID=UPI0010CD3AB1|nr:APC family permease [Citricoccus sp. SGAir0253]QCU79653.1 APC family permease [Citricoccus sp. SGAir0253]